jgi:hypothetical protein
MVEDAALKELKNGGEKMKDPMLLVNLVREIQKEGVMAEEDTIMALIMKIMLRLVKDCTPTSSNVLLSDKSGGGKDHLTKCVCSVMLPKNTYFHRSRLSEKVFTYWKANDKSWSWNGKVIHLEDPETEFLNSQAFKVRASGQTSDTIVENQKAKDFLINGKPVIIVTSMDASINIEGVRRWDSCRLDTTDELTSDIIKRNMLIESGMLKIKIDKELRAAIQNLAPVDVVIPYALAVAEALPSILTMRTQHHKLLDYIKASAILHQFQRKRDNNNRIIANMFDYEYARFCFHFFGNLRGVPLNVAEEQLLDVLLQEGRPLDVKTILSRIDRGHTWLYDKIDRMKGLELIKELYLEEPVSGKEIKHLVARDKIGWKLLPDADTVINTYKTLKTEGLQRFSGGFPVVFEDLSNGSKIDDFGGGFPFFCRCVYILFKTKDKNHYRDIHIHKKGIPNTLQEKNTKKGTGKRAENVRKTCGMTGIPTRMQELREFIESNRESGYKITYEFLTHKFGNEFIDECKKRNLLIQNGDEYICL